MGQLKNLQKQLIRMQMGLISELRKPDTTLDPLKNMWMHNFNVLTGESGPIDYKKLKGFGAFVDVYNAAKMNRDKGRIGRGVAGLSGKYKSLYADDLALESDFNKSILAAGSLEQAYKGMLGQSVSGITGIAQANVNRQGMALQGAQGLNSTLSELTSRPSFWQQLALGGIQAASGLITKI